MTEKIKILYHSDFSLAKTGFGKIAKTILTYLYNTGKYEIVHYCCHTRDNAGQLELTPWKSIGCVPDDSIVNQVVANNAKTPEEAESIKKMIYYGALKIDEVIKSEKPDVYIGVQDIWGVDYSVDKEWFNKINSVIWTTLDSLPLFPRAVDLAPKIKNYWIWSSFATKEFHRKGLKHVETMHGPLEDKFFYRKTDEERLELRRINGIEEDRFMVGFVFRNQQRKSVPNLFEGYKLFKQRNPNTKSGLLLHTHFSEPHGWPIMLHAQENGIDPSEIYTTYVCHHCGNYLVKPFTGDGVKCPKCLRQNTLVTTHLTYGVREEDLNNVYNLMDVYCHPFTSGGQEVPIQEAKLTELITLVTNYSCGEEMCEPEASGLALDWDRYTEPGSNFIKATTRPVSIADKLQKVLEMSKQERSRIGSLARQWVLENFSKDSVGKKFEQFLDNLPEIINQDSPRIEKNPNAIIPNIQDNALWVQALYKEILKMDVSFNDDGLKSWLMQLQRGIPRNQIEDFFRNEANKENIKNGIKKEGSFEDFLDKNDEGRRILFVMPEGIGDVVLSLGLLKSLREQYPSYNIYFATNPAYFSVLEGNPYIYRAIQYLPIMDNLLFLEGNGQHKGFFEIAFIPYVTTQRVLTYVHNGKTNIAFDIIDK